MANVRDSDTSLWLHNKLGTSNDSWTSGSICSQLNAEVLRNIRECFVDLQTQVKLKLLLSFSHIPRRNLEEWRVELEEILEVAQVDSEQWVSMLAEMLKTFPSTGGLNTEVSEHEENRRIFMDLLKDVRNIVKKNGETGMLPMECHYLNKNSLLSVIGIQPQPVKHFTLKRRPKSAALRAELLQKSADAENNLKKNMAPTVPLRSRGMPRKMTNTTPLKGIPSQVPSSGFRSPNIAGSPLSRQLSRTPANKKAGGVKLLDINEQPMGYAQAKKRKRQQEIEDAKKAAEVQQQQQQSNATPDYAVGLVPTNPPTPAPPVTTQATGPSYIPQAPSTPLISSVGGGATTLPTNALGTATAQARENFQQTLQTISPTATIQQPTIVVQTQQTTPAGQQTVLATQTAVMAQSLVQQPQQQTVVVQQQFVQQTPQHQYIQIQQPQVQQTPQQTVQKKGSLSLTREQMLEAQEMFRTANKVTRPEKALILGFMAGSRENPCPHLGNIVTIKLNEDQENVKQSDNTYLTMIVETHFQMNYNTGEWKRIKKHRKMEEST